MIIPQASGLTSSKLHGGTGNQERAIPRKVTPTSRPENGVRKPMVMAAPLVIRTMPSDHLPKEGLDDPEKYTTPAEMAVIPTAMRNSSSPMPGLPPGKVEKNLCSASLQSHPQDLLRWRILKGSLCLEPHIAASFHTTFAV
jgi:hypothetical protein